MASNIRLLKDHNEQDLVLKLKEGEVKAFEELYLRNVNRLLAYAQLYIKDQYKSEEIVQEVFIKIWEKRHLLDNTQSFKGYLFKAVKNHIFNLFRKKVKEIGLEEMRPEVSYAANFTEELIYCADLEQITQQYVNALPLVQKNIFTLSRFEHLNNEEISQKLNISKRTVEHHIYLALKALKKALVPLK